ncbi:endoplasmic reticulum magnesium-transporting P-type ATPase isoform X2 [Eurosta solidaginis]|uniref:endoplasmic reticulum magnesium-transporting P-type ATPase isoform X2 n=1 Tax=Eurosta solidaginis TaxID=178769 RepID=UPI003531370A
MSANSQRKVASDAIGNSKMHYEGSHKEKSNYGLTTRVALARLHDDIKKLLREHEATYAKESLYRKLRSAFVKPSDTPLGWPAISATLLTMIALLIADAYLAAICVAVILSIDLCVVVRENNLRRTEIYRKTRQALADIRLAERDLCGDWQPFNYPHLCCPISPCVSLQWTYRDGNIVNLPWALLVRGDHIVLRPGHITPGPCTEVNGKRKFEMNEIYGPTQVNDPPVRPSARAPLPDLICILQTTPFLDNLHVILEQALKRPSTIYNQQRYLLVTKYIQQWGFICALFITFLAGFMRIHGLSSAPNAGRHPDEQHYWKYVFLETPAAAVIPLLPLIFPLMWISMNLWGVARLQCFLKVPQALLTKDSEKSFEEDLDTPTYDYDNISLLRSNVFRNWLQLWYGDSEVLPRSSNLVQVLGSITALCCIDKKGILSWPNPTAEKVFFLHDTDDERLDERSTSCSTLNTESNPTSQAASKDGGIMAEVLDLTHDQHCPFRLEFDDHEWKAHIKSLKPLGLAILLNTCSPLTHAHYAQFCGHVTAVAMLDKDLVPVTNRRCLCELAKQIGFTDHATDRFTLEGQLASYRHLQPEVVRRDIRFARQLQLSSKVKVPFPHSLSVVMRENPGGYLSLFTQGTADIIMDFCDDFWDGKDLRPLSVQDRKKALDFYQRSALTAYCTAFSYRPLRHGIHGALNGSQHTGGPIAYLELPPESKIRMQHVDRAHCDFGSGHGHTKLSHSISTDSLLFSEAKDDHDINDVDGCFEMQCHQVFIGMVTMQYQAQTDIVQLVERLERACIRFVHFSKENELRSRVFSEKMGLESGWNCHISLLNEAADDKTSTNTGAPAAAAAATKNTYADKAHSCGTSASGKVVTLHHTDNKDTNAINIVESAHTNHTTATTAITINSNNTSTINSPITTTAINKNSNPSLTPPNHVEVIENQCNQKINNIMNNSSCSISSNSTHHNHQKHLNATNITGAGFVGGISIDNNDDDLHRLLPPHNLESSKALSSSAPCAISNPDEYQMVQLSSTPPTRRSSASCGDNNSMKDVSLQLADDDVQNKAPADTTTNEQRQSDDSAMDENCRSMSIITESTEQSAPVHFDMSNRAKLPRGIENIRPHLEQVDNVPLQVSLFTDCSPEATRQMLDIMQSYGEIVVCLGSAASNANANIFLQADCSIAVEPLYPQVCQDVPAYTERNLVNNKLRLLRIKRDLNGEDKYGSHEPYTAEELLETGYYGNDEPQMRPMQASGNTVSPVYLSRVLNSLPCSISVCRDEPLSLVAIIELSRRFSSGLWNCIQYWACCAAALSAINILSTCLSLPPLLTPLMVIYLMCVPVPFIALSLAHIDVDPRTMNRATGKKQTEYDTRVFGFVLWCYGCKFIAPILVMILSYCAFMAHPIELIDVDEDKLHINLHIARIFSFLGILLHFVTISASFVDRDHSLWQRNPFRNSIWSFTCGCILVVHIIICIVQICLNDNYINEACSIWPAIVFLYSGSLLSLIITEICKWQEIKVNTRYQRRARLDFGTKLGMNSPF